MTLSRRFSGIKPLVDSTEDDTEDDDELRQKLFGIKNRFKFSDPVKISFDACSRVGEISSDDEDDDLLEDMAPSWMEEFKQIMSSCNKVNNKTKKAPLLFDNVFCEISRGPLDTLRTSVENYCNHNKDTEAQVVPDKSEHLNSTHARIESGKPDVSENCTRNTELTQSKSTELNLDSNESEVPKKMFNEICTYNVEVKDKDGRSVKNTENIQEFKNKFQASEISESAVEKTNAMDSKPITSEKSDKRLIVLKQSNDANGTENRAEANHQNKSHPEIHKEKNHDSKSQKSKSTKEIQCETHKATKHSKDKKANNYTTNTEDDMKETHCKVVNKSDNLNSLNKQSHTVEFRETTRKTICSDTLVPFENENGLEITQKYACPYLNDKHTKDPNVEIPIKNTTVDSECEGNKTIKYVSKETSKPLERTEASVKSTKPSKEKDDAKQAACKEKRPSAGKLDSNHGIKGNSKTSYKSEDCKKVKTYNITPASSFPLDEILPINKSSASVKADKEKVQRKRHATDTDQPLSATFSRSHDVSANCQGYSSSESTTTIENQMGNVFFGTVYEAHSTNTNVPPVSVEAYQVPPVSSGAYQRSLMSYETCQSNLLYPQHHLPDYTNYGPKEFLVSHFISTNISDIMTAINNGNVNIMSSLQEALNKEIESNLQALTVRTNQQENYVANAEQCDLQPVGFYIEGGGKQHVPCSAGDNRLCESRIAKQSEELFHLFVQQCTQLVKTEEDKIKLGTLMKLLKNGTGTTLTTTGFTPPEIDNQSAIETSCDSDNVSVVSPAPVELFEGRTMLKGGVKPRYIPKAVVYKPGKDAPKDPRKYPKKRARVIADIDLPPFVIEIWGKEMYDRMIARGEASMLLPSSSTSSSTVSTGDNKDQFYNPTKGLQSKSSNQQVSLKQNCSEVSMNKGGVLYTRTECKHLSMKQRQDSQKAFQSVKTTSISGNNKRHDKVIHEQVDQTKRKDKVTGSLNGDEPYDNSSLKDTNNFSTKNWMPINVLRCTKAKTHTIPVLISGTSSTVSSTKKPKDRMSETAPVLHSVVTGPSAKSVRDQQDISSETKKNVILIDSDNDKKSEQTCKQKTKPEEILEVSHDGKRTGERQNGKSVARSDRKDQRRPGQHGTTEKRSVEKIPVYNTMRSDAIVSKRKRSNEETYSRMKSDVNDGERWTSDKYESEVDSNRWKSDKYETRKKSYETFQRRKSDEMDDRWISDKYISEVDSGKWKSDKYEASVNSNRLKLDKNESDIDSLVYERKRSDKTFQRMRSDEIDDRRISNKSKHEIDSGKWKSDKYEAIINSDRWISDKYESEVSSGKRKSDKYGCEIDTGRWKSDKYETDIDCGRRRSDKTETHMRNDEIRNGAKLDETENGMMKSEITIVKTKRKSDENDKDKRHASEKESHRRLSDERRHFKAELNDLETGRGRKDKSGTDWGSGRRSCGNEAGRRRSNEENIGQRSRRQDDTDSICSYSGNTPVKYSDASPHQWHTIGDFLSKSSRGQSSRNYRARHSSTSSVESAVSSTTSLSTRQRHKSSKPIKVTENIKVPEVAKEDIHKVVPVSRSDKPTDYRKRHHTAHDPHSTSQKKRRKDQESKEKRRHSQGNSDRPRHSDDRSKNDPVTNSSSTFTLVNSHDANRKNFKSTGYEETSSFFSKATLSSSKIILSTHNTPENESCTQKQTKEASIPYAYGSKIKEIPKTYQDKGHGMLCTEKTPTNTKKAAASFEEDKLFLENFKRRLSGDKMEKTGQTVIKTLSFEEKAQEREDRLFLESVKKGILEKAEKAKTGQTKVQKVSARGSLNSSTGVVRGVLSYNDMLNLADLEAIEK